MSRNVALVFFISLSGLVVTESTTWADQTSEAVAEQPSQAAKIEQAATADRSAAMFENRSPGPVRKRCVATRGGRGGSEAAVAAALHWIAKHQLPDGGWNFDHRSGPDPDSRVSSHPGSLSGARNAATAMAILPFLGAGQTHDSGRYREEVKQGLSFLTSRIQPNGSLSERGSTMYSHGLAAIALCEAYAMTGDEELKKPAQSSLRFIEYAQDPAGGGWRYLPRQPGDTSVLGWQVSALASGRAAKLEVSPETLAKASNFLDSVQAGDGTYYGYTTPAKRPCTSAVGLVSRVHLGWTHDNKALRDGMIYLGDVGVSRSDMYYNYYANQLMFQCGGEHWKQWNEKMRDHLVNSQAKDGAEKGSWYFNSGHGAEKGGRLYNTSLAAMILEVYYRHARVLAAEVP